MPFIWVWYKQGGIVYRYGGLLTTKCEIQRFLAFSNNMQNFYFTEIRCNNNITLDAIKTTIKQFQLLHT